jgi:DNA (cytosine-5)-methyltransferase 1
LDLLPTPTVSDTNGSGSHGDGGPDLRTAGALLPTPDATHGRKTTRTSVLLPGVVETLLPKPRATDGEKGGPNQRGSRGDLMLTSAVILLQVICEHGLLPTGGRFAPPSPDGNTP